MITLSINWSAVGLQAAQLLLSLSILVVLHEFGHYITARIFKCRVEKFYLFFDPWFSLFKKKVGNTEYGIGWLPLGGYVKIAGMIDESMDKEQLNKPPEDWEFRSKPAWQRLIIMIGGVAVNVILAFIIYAMILMVWGEKNIKADSLKYGIVFNDPIFADIGLKNGDKVVAIDGKKQENFTEILKDLLLANRHITVMRDEKELTLAIPKDLNGKLVQNKRKKDVPLLSPRVPMIILGSVENSPAQAAGLKKGDLIVQINGQEARFKDQYNSIVGNQKKGAVLNIVFERNGQQINAAIQLEKDADLEILTPTRHVQYDSLKIYVYKTEKYDFFRAIPAGIKKAGMELSFYMDQFKKILTPGTGAYKGVGGFKSMGSVFSGTDWDWEHFWTITAFFSIVLAFMNLLPIPALDGGHVLFTLVEMITRRKPSQKFLEYAQIVGMIIMLALMVFANANDWFGWGK